MSLVAGCAALHASAEESFVPCVRFGHWRECITVPLASVEQDAVEKEFRLPASDKAKIYIIRSSTIEPKTKSAIFFDGKSAAYLAPMTYMVIETIPGRHYIKAHMDHDFDLTIDLAPGRIQYVGHQLTLLFNTVSGALRPIDEKEGQSQVLRSKLARSDVNIE